MTAALVQISLPNLQARRLQLANVEHDRQAVRTLLDVSSCTKGAVAARHCKQLFIKHVFPPFIKPRAAPRGSFHLINPSTGV